MLSERLQPPPSKSASFLKKSGRFFRLAGRRYFSLLWASLIYVLLLFGYYRNPQFSAVHAILLMVLALALLIGITARLASTPKDPWESALANFKQGWLLILALGVLVQVFEEYSETLYPINYLLMALLYAFNTPKVGLGLLALMVGLDWGTWLSAGGTAANAIPWLHTLATVAFAMLVGGFYKREYRQRLLAQDKVRVQRHSESDLMGGATPAAPKAQEEGDLSKSGMHKLRQRIAEDYEGKISQVCELLRKATHSNSALLLRFDALHETLTFWEGDKNLDECEFHRGAVPYQKSLFRPLIDGRLTTLTQHWGEKQGAQLHYYVDTPDIRSLKARVIPTREGKVQALLIVESLEEHHYDRYDPIPAMDMAGAQIRILQDLQGTQLRLEEDRQREYVFKRESERLNANLNVKATSDIVCESSCDLVGCDATIVAIKQDDANAFDIVSVHHEPDNWKKMEKIVGQSFDAQSGFLGPTILKRYKEKDFMLSVSDWTRREHSAPVFAKSLYEPPLGSLLALPLIRMEEDQAHLMGVIVLMSAQPNAFTQHEKTIMGAFSAMVASALKNAVNYEEQLAKATTDGLTGLHNHRYFQEWMDRTLAGAKRYPESIALLLTDIDKFKNVNDTYGHPAGDEVLRRIARVMSDTARDLDLAARYGGEEFVMVLRQTDIAGAVKFAERLRKTIEKLNVAIDSGETLRVTLSIGIAMFPEDSQTKGTLLEYADQGLYYAKEHGRNQSVVYREIKKG